MLTTIFLYVGIAIAALLIGQLVGKLIFKGTKDLSTMRKAAQSIAISLREVGLRRLPVVLEDFAVGDVPDLLEGLRDMAAVVKGGNESLIKELDGTFERVLGVKLSSPEGRAVIKARLAEAEKIALETAKVVAPVVLAAALA